MRRRFGASVIRWFGLTKLGDSMIWKFSDAVDRRSGDSVIEWFGDLAIQ